ncbi:hypothetical protein [Paenibacillus harenae]|uniref:hypothetical protein n=1 Tax=Paenibacillus harenae TaxID=306543 RepID=UPI0027924E7B|nr:hypothetical protein [Paenibacillus harenae]MDQ0062275.1 hypothetical protein [Paenibacillus harenae]
MDQFELAHKALIEEHLERRKGERKGRLLRGHSFGERLLLQNVWWPLFGSFEHCHPEYEIYDWNRKSQFLDLAYITPFGRFGIECDGFQSHVKDMDRERFNYSLNRDTFLTGLGWKMIHFSFDDIERRPELCRMLLQHVIGPYMLRKGNESFGSVTEKELLQFAWRLGRPIRPKDVCDLLNVDFRTARRLLLTLAEKGWLRNVSQGKTARYYELAGNALHMLR